MAADYSESNARVVAAIAQGSKRGVRGGRCTDCNLVWAWRPTSAAPLTGAHCERCGEPLQQTTANNCRRVRVVAGRPWYRAETGPRGLGDRRYVRMMLGRYVAVQVSLDKPDGRPAFWYCATWNDAGRLVRQWAPADVDAPPWLARELRGRATS